LTKEHIGQRVSLAGWLQFHRVEGTFLVLRDGYGSTQVFIPTEVKSIAFSITLLTLIFKDLESNAKS